MAWTDVAPQPPPMPTVTKSYLGRPYDAKIICRCRPLGSDPDEPGFCLSINDEMTLGGDPYLLGSYFDKNISELTDDDIPDVRHVRIVDYEFWFNDAGTNVFINGVDLEATAVTTPIL